MELFNSFKFLSLRTAFIMGLGIIIQRFLSIPFYLLMGILFLLFMISLKLHWFLYGVLFFLSFAYGKIRDSFALPSFLFYKPAHIKGVVEEGKRNGGYHTIRISSINDNPTNIKALFYNPRYLKRGTRLECKGEIRPIIFCKNEGTQSPFLRYTRKNIYIKFYPSGRLKLFKKAPTGFEKIIRNTRDYISNVSEKYLKENAGYIEGMLLGEKGGFSPEEFDKLKKAGILHIFAVSGLHVGIIVSVFFIIARIAGIGNILFSIILGLFLIFYSALTKFQPSVLRASLMAYFLVLGLITERKNLPIVSLAVAFIIIIIISPGSLFSPGFQLSFAATAGIIVMTEVFPYRRIKGLLKYLYPGGYFLFVSFMAFTGALFVQAYHFKNVSFVSPISSLMVVPLVGIIIPASFIMFLLHPVIPSLSQIIGNAVWLLIEAIKQIVLILSKVPMFHAQQMPSLIYFLPIGFLYLVYTFKNKKFIFLFSILFILNTIIFYNLLNTQKDGFILLNAKYGKVVLIRANHTHILINAGSKRDYTLKRFLESWGINKIEYLVLPTEKKGNNSGLELIRDKVEQVIKLKRREGVRIKVSGIKIEIVKEKGDFSLLIFKNKKRYAIIPYLSQRFKNYKIVYTGKGEKIRNLYPIMTYYNLFADIFSVKREGGKWVYL